MRRFATTAATLLLTLFVESRAQEPALRGVGPYESDEFAGMKVSMAGGAYLNIAASDYTFNSSPIKNELFFKVSGLPGNEDLTIKLPEMSGKSLNQFALVSVYQILFMLINLTYEIFLFLEDD